MAITNKFKVYGENSLNLLSDDNYASNSVRDEGAQAGQAISSSITNTALKTASMIGIAFIDALGLRNTSSELELGLSTTMTDLRDSFKTLMDGYIGDRMSPFTDELTHHISATNNPHSVTKAQVGLGNVVNTSDSATPVSGGTTKFTTGGAYTELAKKVDKTTTVNGHALSGNVTVTKSDVGLGNVNNTSDIDKPISSATQTALNLKVNITTKVNGHALSGDVTVTKSDVGLGSVANTGDSATPTENGTTKFTTGGAYSLQESVRTVSGKVSNSSSGFNVPYLAGLRKILYLELILEQADEDYHVALCFFNYSVAYTLDRYTVIGSNDIYVEYTGTTGSQVHFNIRYKSGDAVYSNGQIHYAWY